ncbi:TonB-dependent receptor [Luteimonas aestuarii]|uniref:TonB-dependent receptor n=1 Tax=Luteimonas aestuarii TaxID=453837 RepID=A0A4R5TPC3_9GAMM|nr:TonB-dependent receptor [Luteimonas aestuarii]TDK24294.1 TonB-dependent receptor [Luteimonas aestuarii]
MGSRLIATASVAALLAVPVSALAQATTEALEAETGQAQAQAPADARELDRVIVTATRRSQPLKDVPLSVTVLSQEELDAKGIVGYEGLAHTTPGVVLNRPTANFNNFTARGIATNGYNANLQSTVAIYIDELPISSNGNSTILDPSLYDVERVEFLRGPQGTLFGSGSLAGALRILTRAPDPNVFEASFLGDLGIRGSGSLRQRYNAMVNVPLAEDTLALRVVAFKRHEEGYVDNIGTGVDNANTIDTWGGRATLLWEPNDRLSVQLRASQEDSNPRDSGLTNPDLGEDVRYSDRPDRFAGKMTNYNATIGYQFDGARLTSSSTWSDYRAHFDVDLAATFGHLIPFGLEVPYQDDRFVQEVRLVSDSGGRVDWVLGGFYFEQQRNADYYYRSSQAFLDARGMNNLPVNPYYLRFRNTIDQRERALFGELTFRFNDDLWATGGLRYGSTQAQATQQAGGYNSNYLVAALTGATGPLTIIPIEEIVGLEAKETGPSYRLSLSWRPTPAITTYAAVATGFRAPIVNARAGAPSLVNAEDIIIPFGADSDELINYELGLKGRWLDGRLAANLALYHIDWNDIQVQANRVSDSVQFATNIGGAISQGLEFELMARPSASWTFSLNGSFNRTEVDSLTPEEAAISGAVLGARLSAPRFQGSMVVDYGFDAFGDAAGNASFSLVHVGGFPGMFPNVPGQPGTVSPMFDYTESYTIANANLSFAFDRFTVGAYVENIFDDRSITYVHPEAFLDGRYARVPPRTFGVRFGYSF